MRNRIAKRWRNKAIELHAKHGNDVEAIRADLRQQYGSAATFLLIAKWVLFFIELWMKLGISQPGQTPSPQELDEVELSEEDHSELSEE
jgi:hypothetical protein